MVITHIGMDLGGLAALMTAGQMARAYARPPHASAVYASVEPGHPTSVHWIGDCRAYGWDGAELTLWSTDQTMGQWLRWNGGTPIEIAATRDNRARLGLAQAGAVTCRQLEIPEEVSLVLLCSDGVCDQVSEDVWKGLMVEHADDPQALADALVRAVESEEGGDGELHRDDATAVVLLRHPA